MSSEIDTNRLTLRAGTFERGSGTNRGASQFFPRGDSRWVRISDCTVIRGGRDIWKDDFGDKRFEASAHEIKSGDVLWEEDPEKIGVLDGQYINFYLPQEAFAHFWTAADAREGSAYNIDLELKSDPRRSSGFFNVIHVGLHETLSASNVANDLRPPLERIRQAIIALMVVTGIGAIWIVGTLKHWF